MKKLYIILFLFTLAISQMIIVNEYYRHTADINEPESFLFVKGISSNITTKEKCTWSCHHNTTYCMNNHIKRLTPTQLATSKKYYFGLITLLNTGNMYMFANIILLILVVPLTIIYFITESILIQIKLKK